MLGLILGILIILLGIIVGIYLIIHQEEEYGSEKITFPYRKYSGLSFIIGIVIGIGIVFSGCICNVPTGHTGIITVFGRVKDNTLDSGFHTKAPWESIVKMDNRVQKETVELSCFSSDIQEVKVMYTLNFQINKQNASQIYKTIGKNYYEITIAPAIAESVKVVVAQYTAEELIGARELLAESVENNLALQLERFNIEVVSTAIEDMDFTDSFTDAVEAKQVADQKAKQAKIEQEQAKMEANYNKDIIEINANAAAEVAVIQAQADMEVAKISADSAEYQGKKEAAIALQRLASINGWTVITTDEGINTLVKPDGTLVSDVELKAGAENLIKYYYTQQWNGILPSTYMSTDDVSTVVVP